MTLEEFIKLADPLMEKFSKQEIYERIMDKRFGIGAFAEEFWSKITHSKRMPINYKGIDLENGLQIKAVTYCLDSEGPRTTKKYKSNVHVNVKSLKEAGCTGVVTNMWNQFNDTMTFGYFTMEYLTEQKTKDGDDVGELKFRGTSAGKITSTLTKDWCSTDVNLIIAAIKSNKKVEYVGGILEGL